MRDMSQREFDAACIRRGFKKGYMLGYYELPSGLHVSILNARPTRRAQLAYLIKCDVREQWEQSEADRLGVSLFAYKQGKAAAR